MEDELETNISGLEPNTSYVISVSGNNTLGWGEEAERSITTMPRMTEQLFDVTEVKSKSFMVTAKMSATHMHLQCDMIPNTNGAFTLTQLQRNETLKGLTPNTQYTIRCVAKDEDGRDACVEQTRIVTTRKNRELVQSLHD